jgi:hypothetical protein
MCATTAPLVDKKFGPGHAAYLKTRADLPAEAVWGAPKDFTAERPKLWPFIEPSLYEVYEVGERHAEAKEGTKLGPGMSVWARERYEWDDQAMEMRATVVESSMFKPGGTSRFKVTADDGGCSLEDWYERERLGVLGRIMNALAPRLLPKMVPKGRGKTFAAIAERRSTLQ